jgi:hypothetical protein
MEDRLSKLGRHRLVALNEGLLTSLVALHGAVHGRAPDAEEVAEPDADGLRGLGHLTDKLAIQAATTGGGHPVPQLDTLAGTASRLRRAARRALGTIRTDQWRVGR